MTALTTEYLHRDTDQEVEVLIDIWPENGRLKTIVLGHSPFQRPDQSWYFEPFALRSAKDEAQRIVDESHDIQDRCWILEQESEVFA